MQNELDMMLSDIGVIILFFGAYLLFWIIGICIVIFLVYQIIQGGNNANNNQ